MWYLYQQIVMNEWSEQMNVYHSEANANQKWWWVEVEKRTIARRGGDTYILILRAKGGSASLPLPLSLLAQDRGVGRPMQNGAKRRRIWTWKLVCLYSLSSTKYQNLKA